MTYALVDSGVVVQVIVADAVFIADCGTEVKTNLGYVGGTWEEVPEGDIIGIGWTWDGDVFAPPA